jgi:hypothetical protein
MVGDQVLGLPHQRDQLVHLTVAASQLTQQPPPQRMSRHAQKLVLIHVLHQTTLIDPLEVPGLSGR